MDCSTYGARTSIENNEFRSQAHTVNKETNKQTDMRIKSGNESKLSTWDSQQTTYSWVTVKFKTWQS